MQKFEINYNNIEIQTYTLFWCITLCRFKLVKVLLVL